MRTWIIACTAIAFGGAAVPGVASTFVTDKYRCAVGGERFTAKVQVSMSSFGQRPDGMLYHTGMAPPIECPSNGLVYYKEKFSKEEVARLGPLVTSAAYQSMRRTDTPEYRAYWLQKQMGVAQGEVIESLLAATWSSERDLSRKARYQREFVASAITLPHGMTDRFWLQLRSANALRELGEHAESERLLNALTVSAGAVADADADERRAALELIVGLKTLNAERNRASEPLNLIPDMIAAEQCARPTRLLTESEAKTCGTPAMKKLVADLAAAPVSEQ